MKKAVSRVLPGLVALAIAGAAGAEETVAPPEKDPIKEDYAGYKPDFLDLISQHAGYKGAAVPFIVPAEAMDISSEKSFYSLNLVEESDRANALVAAGIQKEKEGRHGEAAEIYQKVLDEYGSSLFRVCPYGVFVPVGQYCQRRLLNLPKEALTHYRTKYDSRAKDTYEQARRQRWLIGFSEITGNLLATSYGDKSLLELGKAAMDNGNYLQALEHFETIRNFCRDSELRGAELDLSIRLCRKMLGQDRAGGPLRGLVGHWKLDEAAGTRVADASGLDHHGTIRANDRAKPEWAPQWVPGKAGGALLCNWTYSVSVPAATTLTLGEGGTDFSVAYWIKWDQRGGAQFTMAAGADNMLSIHMAGKNQIQYTIATGSPQWETGISKGALTPGQWTHIALVKAGQDVKLFLNGRLDARQPLKAPALRNAGGVTFGQDYFGAVDDVRLYNRELADREVAELAGTLGTATLSATPASGEAPLTTEFTAPGAPAGALCRWDFGDGESATGAKVRHTYGVGGDYTAVLSVTDTNGAVSGAAAAVSVQWPPGQADFAKRMSAVIAAAKPDFSTRYQRSSPPNASADDYAPFPPTEDPLALKPPVWSERLPVSGGDMLVWSQPVLTSRSVIYRHKNILYCRSILNGELRWKNDLGGRVTWQSPPERQYPMEDIVVKDGLVFTPMYKIGPSLAAIDEISGQLRWAYGPMVAATVEESRMRFESSPAGGPGAVYAGYILDNIEGETHTDTEYGMMAFESTTGRVLWQTRLSRMRPGKFSAGFAESRRNKIRSFSSPPLYHEGTLYHCDNAGAVAALDALSGRVKWLMRYPYYPSVHDATRVFGDVGYRCHGWRPHSPMFWFNQRPVMLGERVLFLPVNTRFMLCLDRKTGKVDWSRFHPDGYTWVVGPTKEGHLVQVTCGSGRSRTVSTLDPAAKGKTVWAAPPVLLHDDQPVMKYPMGYIGEWSPNVGGIDVNNSRFYVQARPFLTTDGRLYVTTQIDGGPWTDALGHWCFALAEISLAERRALGKRRYYAGSILRHAGEIIGRSPGAVKDMENAPTKLSAKQLQRLQEHKEVAADHVPVNKYGPFAPFSRATLEHFGILFELRFGPQELGVLYDAAALDKVLAARTDPDAEFAKAEIAINRGKYEEAAERLNRCLALVSAEDVDFRTQVNQQLYALYKRLARGSVQSGLVDQELRYGESMSRSVTRLDEEIETLLALSEANERKGEYATSARELQSVVETYGQYEYPIPSLMAADTAGTLGTAEAILGRAIGPASRDLLAREASRALSLEKKGLPVYLSILTPLEKDLLVRAGDLAIGKLLRLQQTARPFAEDFAKAAAKALQGKSAEERFYWIRAYPGTPAAQTALDGLLKSAADRESGRETRLEDRAESRRQMWALADLARVCGLNLPEAYRPRLLAPAGEHRAAAVKGPMEEKTTSLEDERSTAWLVAPRRDDEREEPDRLFLAGRVKKKLDNKFVLYGWDLKAGKVTWKATEQRGDQWFDEIRLDAKGDEAGFRSVYVHGDLAVTHGLFDVLAFNLKDGRLRWRYRVPYDFDIRESLFSGDLMILQGKAESVALYLPTEDPRGEVAWQEKEEGDLYVPGYFVGDRLVEVRKMPFNVTARYRGTGKLISRLTIPDLLLEDGHPLIDDGPRELPVAHDGKLLVATDGFYYLAIDVEQMRIVWKRLIDANDPTRQPRMRMALSGEYLAVLKEDFDKKALYVLSSRTGEVLWPLKKLDKDGKVTESIEGARPMHELYVQGQRLYGIIPHEGQGFYLACVDCKTGKNLFPPHEEKGYEGKPELSLIREDFGGRLVVKVKDRQDYELKVFDANTGKLEQKVSVKGVGDFGVHGAVSATVQNGKLALLGRNDLVVAK